MSSANAARLTSSPSHFLTSLPGLVDEAARLRHLPPVGFEDARQRIFHSYDRLPVEVGTRVGDLRHTVLDVLVALAIVDVGEGTLLRTAVDQLDGLAAHDVSEKLRDDARTAFLRRIDRIEAGADPVERAEQRVVEAFLHAVRVDDAVHQLLRA